MIKNSIIIKMLKMIKKKINKLNKLEKLNLFFKIHLKIVKNN